MSINFGKISLLLSLRKLNRLLLTIHLLYNFKKKWILDDNFLLYFEKILLKSQSNLLFRLINYDHNKKGIYKKRRRICEDSVKDLIENLEETKTVS